MAREISVSLYLFLFKWTFRLFNLLPLKEKTTFVVSFGDNSQYVFEEMRRRTIQTDVVFLCKGNSRSIFKGYSNVTVLKFESSGVLDWFKSIYHLATSRHILVDNYYGFLAVTDFKEGVECIQLWHATGAIKKFGLKDQSIKNRSMKAHKRFRNVYQKFDKVIVGSDSMATIFQDAFGLNDENILRTGVPRTDFFYDKQKMQEVYEKLTVENKFLSGKTVILYAPTYRDNELNQYNLQLDLDLMRQKLGNEYIVILRLHPAVKITEEYSERYQGFVYDYSSSRYHINELLIVCDYLITDYSSIPYEFSLLKKPIIFFTYDLESYLETRGIWDGFSDNLPGPIVRDTNTIINVIQKGEFDIKRIETFADIWNRYSQGHSSYNLVNYMFEESVRVQKQDG